MYKRYLGNSGQVIHVPEKHDLGRNPSPPVPPPVPPPRAQGGLLPSLNSLLPDTFGALETEDVLLLLILYLMYRESGDSELLVIMGAMFLL